MTANCPIVVNPVCDLWPPFPRFAGARCGTGAGWLESVPAMVTPAQRIKTRTGAPTPDDLDELLTKVWKEPGFFLLHPRAVAAFGREATRRGVPPPTVSLFGSQFVTWRGIPLIPSDKIAIE